MTALTERPALTVIHGGRNQPALIQVPRAAWDELLISRTTASAERVAAAEQERRYLMAALAALGRVQPDVDAAERLLAAALRVANQEATRAAADIEPGPEPVVMDIAA